MENSHGNDEKPPRSATIVGTAVARIVESIATRLVVIMIAMRIGPRSERKPTPSESWWCRRCSGECLSRDVAAGRGWGSALDGGDHGTHLPRGPPGRATTTRAAAGTTRGTDGRGRRLTSVRLLRADRTASGGARGRGRDRRDREPHRDDPGQPGALRAPAPVTSSGHPAGERSSSTTSSSSASQFASDAGDRGLPHDAATSPRPARRRLQRRPARQREARSSPPASGWACRCATRPSAS